MAGSPWDATGVEVLGANDFRDGRLERPGTYVVCFGAAWCPVTRRFVPKFVARKDSVGATLAIADITDNSSPLWDRFRIRITPTIVVFRDGAEASRLDGRRLIGITEARWTELATSMRSR
jgi:hypothetical protein